MNSINGTTYSRLLVLAALLCTLATSGCGNDSPNAGTPDGGDPCGDRAEIEQPPITNNSCRILVGSCPHRGADLIHDICSDALPPNVAWDNIFLAIEKLPNLANPPNGRA